MVKVSVIMPARNVGRYVDEAVRSVLAQRGVDYELLVVDDASTDDTWDRIRKYQNDSRVRAWRFRKRRGAGGARNYLMARAKGIYFAMCDADDTVLPGYLRTMMKVLDSHSDVGVVYADRLVRDPAGKLRPLRRSQGPAETWDLCDGPISNPGTLIRRAFIRKVGGYRVDLPVLEDYDLFWRLAEITRFLYLKGKPLYFYRKRPGSLSRQSKRLHAAVRRKIFREVLFRRYGFQVAW